MKTNVLFSLPSEALKGAEKVFVLGDFNNWTSQKGFELKIQEDGSASATIPLEAGKTYRYRFLINDNTWVNDYNAERYESVAGYGIDNCVISVAAPTESEPIVEEKAKKVKKPAATAKSSTSKSAKPAAKSASKKVAAKSEDKKTKATKTTKEKATKSTTPKPKAKKTNPEDTINKASVDGSEIA